MTKQQTFNIVVAHARKQRKRAALYGHNGYVLACQYRTPNGLKCFAGALIPDKDYSPSMEGYTADDSGVAELLTRDGHDVELVRQLQSIHDCKKVEAWEANFQSLAKEHGLTYSPR